MAQNNCFSGKRHLETAEFYKAVKDKLADSEPMRYALAVFDFDNFYCINDMFGYEVGDNVLNIIVHRLDENLKDGEFFTKLQADHFAVFIDTHCGADVQQRLHNIADIKKQLETVLPLHYTPFCSGGIIMIQNVSDLLPTLMDKANFARKQAKNSGLNNFILYDQLMEKELEWSKTIMVEGEEAMQNHEFVMYLQPKISIKDHRIVGAEALVRWNSPKHGFLCPDSFIPIFEQSGFVRHIDFFMLEEACRFLQACEQDNFETLPLSVNFSKVHLKTPDFAKRIIDTVVESKIEPKYIEIEMTENAFFHDFNKLLNLSSVLRAYGFLVSIDDFGKANPSLNRFKKLPLDIIKIDKGFFNASADAEHGRDMITKTMEQIKSRRMISCMTGVETEEQAEFLKKLDCDIAQGFYFAKPMPVAEFRDFVRKNTSINRSDAVCEESPVKTGTVAEEFFLDNRELYILGKNIDMGLVKGDLTGDVTVEFINDRALEYFGYTREELKENFHNSLYALTYPEDKEKTRELMRRLTEGNGSVRYHTRIIRKDGKIITVEGQSSCVVDEAGRKVGLHAFRDITNDMEKEATLESSIDAKIKELEISNERYGIITALTEDIIFEWNLKNDKIHFSDRCEKVFGINADNVQFSRNLENRLKIHPADTESFDNWARDTRTKGGVREAEYRVKNKENIYVWLKVRSTTNCDENGIPDRVVGVFSDVNKQKTELDYLKTKSQIDPLTRLYNKEETRRRIDDYIVNHPKGKAAYIIIDIDNFKGVNDSLGHQFGDLVLRELSHRIASSFCQQDVIGRLGGDEIIVFIEDVKSKTEVSSKIEKMLSAVRGTYFGATSKYDVSVSAGVAFFPKDSVHYEGLYRYADAALYSAKRHGKDCYTFYQNEFDDGDVRTRTPMDITERFLYDYFEGDLIYNIFEQLYETKDFDTTVQMILEMLGKKYSVDRVYIFENSEDGNFSDNTHEWCAEGIASEKENLQHLSTVDLKPFLDSFGREGILCRNDIAEMDPFSYQRLGEQGIKSLLHCAICDGGKMTGFVGFDMCKTYREWKGEEVAILGYVSRVLSVFLLKRHALKEIEQQKRNYEKILDDIGGLVYVIDRKSYELLYANSTARNNGFVLGRKCYDSLEKKSKPCKFCSIAKLDRGEKVTNSEFYASFLKKWMLIRMTPFKLENGRDAVLICGDDISQYKKDAPEAE